MKTFGCLIISALAIYALVPTLGYEFQPLHGRNVKLFSWLTSPQALLTRLANLSARYTILQSTVDILSSQFTALQNFVNNLQILINTLQNSIPKCPSAVSGGKIISGLCYTVTNVAAGITFTAAQAACAIGGGSLAEPTPTILASTAFYSALKTKFPAQFATIEASAPKAIWIGYIQPTPPVLDSATDSLFGQILGTEVKINPLAQIWGANPIPTVVPNPLAAAIIGTTGNSWAAIDSTTLVAATPKAYVCQYNTF